MIYAVVGHLALRRPEEVLLELRGGNGSPSYNKPREEVPYIPRDDFTRALLRVAEVEFDQTEEYGVMFGLRHTSPIGLVQLGDIPY